MLPTLSPVAEAAPALRVPPENPSSPRSPRRAVWPGALAAGVLVTLWLVLCWRLSAEWSVSEQYAYGWLVPFLTLALFALRWETRPPLALRNVASPTWLVALGFVFLFTCFPIRLFEDANPDWRLLGWLHAGVVAGLTLLFLQAAGGWRWVRHFAFPVGFFFVAVPWIKSFEEAVVQTLMHAAAALAADGLGVLGIPAQLEGNLIRLSTGATVGVNEACSGVRGLQTSLMIGLLLGELQRLAAWRRVALVALAVVLALGANVTRAFFLVWLTARHGAAAAERGHDAAGYAILGTVFVGTLALAAWLKEKPSGKQTVVADPTQSLPPIRWPVQPLAGALLWLFAIEIGVEAWYRWHERGLVEGVRWTVRWPETTSGFRELRLDEHTRRILRFDQGRGVVFPLARPAETTAPSLSCLAYFFRWQPGRNTALLANAHRPDICLPASGWDQVADRGVRRYFAAPGLDLPVQHLEFVRTPPAESARFANPLAQPNPTPSAAAAMRAHVFYCLWEDRASTPAAATRPALYATDPAPAATTADADEAMMDTSLAPSTREQRWDLVRTGRRHLGQQVLELALLAPLSSTEAERLFAAQLPGLIRLEASAALPAPASR